MADLFEIEKGVPLPISSREKTGLLRLIRNMDYLDTITIPGAKLSSIHPSAKAAGAKVKTRKNVDGTITVWRTDRPMSPSPTPAVPVAGSSSRPFKSAFVVTAPSSEHNLPAGYYTMEPAGSQIWHEGPPPDAPPGYVPPAPIPSSKPKYQPPASTSIMPPGLSFTLDDVPYLGHRHSTFRSPEGTRAILNFHGCDSTAEGQALSQPQLNTLCFAFVLALGQDNHSSLLTDHPQLQSLFSSLGWKPTAVGLFSGPPASATKPFSMEELCSIFYRFADHHTIEKARDILTPFNCSRSISQAWYNLGWQETIDLVLKLDGPALTPTPTPSNSTGGFSIFD